MSLEKEVALDNLADYTSITKLKLMYQNIHKLETMMYGGNTTAQCIWIDLTEAMKSNKLTNRQKQCLELRYIFCETNVKIAEDLKIGESGVRKNLEGGLKRIRKILLGQC
jgi:DNA-directed RNA polymerase sigma subunit (sigma70/sigma32)